MFSTVHPNNAKSDKHQKEMTTLQEYNFLVFYATDGKTYRFFSIVTVHIFMVILYQPDMGVYRIFFRGTPKSPKLTESPRPTFDRRSGRHDGKACLVIITRIIAWRTSG